ncbi:hypothetical protein H4R24_005510 [Coemansia sp. RSA 988]|nr:hypothetical protein H4R24_005510 [Coemansia sp. RSA 988]
MRVLIKPAGWQLSLASRCANQLVVRASPISPIMRHYVQKQRGRERIKFPWIWPSDKQQTPARIRKVYKDEDNPLIFLSNKAGNINANMLFNLKVEDDYMKDITKTAIPVILEKTIEAINKRDYDTLGQLMTPDLSKLYGYALANMEALKYRLEIEATNICDAEIEGLRALSGPPMAFNASIPAQKRLELFNYLFVGSLHLALPKSAGTSVVRTLINSYNSWLGFEVWFKVKANIKISLSLNGKVIDEDQGEMEVPLSLVTPHYPSLRSFPNVTMDDGVQFPGDDNDAEPFQWRISDIFSIKTHNDLSSMVSSFKPK